MSLVRFQLAFLKPCAGMLSSVLLHSRIDKLSLSTLHFWPFCFPRGQERNRITRLALSKSQENYPL